MKTTSKMMTKTTMKTTRKITPKITRLAMLFVLAGVALAGAPFVGAKTIPLGAVLGGAATELETHILWRIRIPRVLISFIAGAGLAVSGMAFQALFRNPLAAPFTLGVASGASLGAAVYVWLGLPFILLWIPGVSVFAFLGAALSISLVYGLTRARRGSSTATMLLAGVAVSLFFASLILFTQYMSDYTQSFRILRWLMGDLAVVGFEPVLNMLPFVAGGCAILLYFTRELNLLTTGEDIAMSRGVDVRRTKAVVFFATSLMVGGVVAITGPIGFVGMMAPHICRLLVGWDHRLLAPATVLFGGAFLVACDTLSRTLIPLFEPQSPVEIPVGVITALLGGPFFLWLLLGGSSERSTLWGYR